MRVRAGWQIVVLSCVLAGLPLCATAAERAVLKKAMPVYPELARKMRVYGLIKLTVSILPSGEVTDIVLESGHPLLVNAARDAVRQWKFAAAGETTTASVVVRFDLPE